MQARPLHWPRTQPLYSQTMCGLSDTYPQLPEIAETLDDVNCKRCIAKLAGQVEEALQHNYIDAQATTYGLTRRDAESDADLFLRISAEAGK